MRLHFRNLFGRSLVVPILLGSSVGAFAQSQNQNYQARQSAPARTDRAYVADPRLATPGQFPGTLTAPPYSDAAYLDRFWRDRARASQNANGGNADSDFLWYGGQQRQESDPQAKPDSPDQSDLLKNSHDREFILRNFRTMYVDAHEANYFGSSQMKAALGKNKDFEKLGFRIVDDRRVADVVLKVSYTFAWDYPFELMHQNSTIVLLSGKGEGPFSGPLGAADVARVFVNTTKPWRTAKQAEAKPEVVKPQ